MSIGSKPLSDDQIIKEILYGIWLHEEIEKDTVEIRHRLTILTVAHSNYCMESMCPYYAKKKGKVAYSQEINLENNKEFEEKLDREKCCKKNN